MLQKVIIRIFTEILKSKINNFNKGKILLNTIKIKKCNAFQKELSQPSSGTKEDVLPILKVRATLKRNRREKNRLKKTANRKADGISQSHREH